MVKDLRGELKSVISFLPLGVVSVLLVFLMTESGMAGSGGLFESPTSPLPISPILSPVAEETVGPLIPPIPSPFEEEAIASPTLPPLIAVRTQPNYWPWVLGGLVIIGGVVGMMLYRRGRGDEG